MKRIISIFLCVGLFFSTLPMVYASENNLIQISKSVYSDDVVVIDEIIELSDSRSIDKTYLHRKTFQKSDVTIAVIAITVTFRYDGNTVSVVSKSVSQCDTYDGWSYKQTSFTSSGGTVTLNGKLTKLLILNNPIQMTLSCDKNGNITYT